MSTRQKVLQKVLIIDTSILCVWLEIPGKETCSSDRDRWDRERVDRYLQIKSLRTNPT